MILEDSILYFVIFLFSIVQSIFGVGLLLFGTPTLLLLGYPYDEILWMLLPASITISIVQIARGYIYVESNRKVYFFTIPPLVVCLIFVIVQGDSFDISKVIGAALLFVGFIRYSSVMQSMLENLIDRHINLYYMMMGAIHGVSNMGGGPLSVLMATIYSEKYTIRTNIALFYLIFGVAQLCVLAFISLEANRAFDVWFSVIAFVSYLMVGRFLARIIDDSRYQELITIVIMMYGVISFI